MKILLEAHHPAHVHFWKYPIRELQARGHEVLLIGRDRDVMRRLLEVYDWIPSVIPPRKNKKNRFPLLEMLQRQCLVAKQIREFRPGVVASLMGSYTQVAKLLGVHNLVFTDSEFQHLNHRIAHPFADEIYTPECFYKNLGRKQRRYNGIHELSFLHPAVFQKEPSVLEPYPGLESGQYLLIRLSAWNTLHDRKQSGIGQSIYRFVERFASSFRIIISAEEKKVPPGLENHVRAIRAEDFHQIIAQARFVLSEGASTAAEAACLGVPCTYINSTERRGYLDLLEERYGVVTSFHDADEGMAHAEKALLETNSGKDTPMRAVRERIRNDFPDVSKLITEILLRSL